MKTTAATLGYVSNAANAPLKKALFTEAMAKRARREHERAPHECEVCGVRFAKAAKRDVHLLDVHGASFGLSPRALSPSAAGPVAETVSRAVAEANLAFAASQGQRTAVLCAACPESSTTKFRNPRDLSQHILAKHTELLSERSAVSMAPPPAKRRKTLEPVAMTRNVKIETKGVKASAMKPPLSPKRSGSSRSSSPSKKLSVSGVMQAELNCTEPVSVRELPAVERRPVELDFSSVVGFTTNSRKSYYRVKKR